MTKKKTSKTKKNLTKSKKEIDINNIDAMFEDMKKLTIETPKEEENEIVSEEVKVETPFVPKEEVEQVAMTEEFTVRY